MTQPDEARRHFLECASDDPEELPALLKNLEMMFRDLTKNRPYEIYANSPNFDCTIMKSLYNDHGMTIPWDFRKERDLRTLCSMAGINAKEVAKTELRNLVSEQSEHEVREIVDYIEWQCNKKREHELEETGNTELVEEFVQHAEKIKTERVMGTDYSVWDVHTKDRKSVV